ncbi:MAG: response regulator [Helicobacteraceae bacterium]|nr:response regulator [Helicobacteraceae bacterium]
MKKIKILYAEDQIVVQQLVTRVLRNHPHTEITFVQNGEVALELYKKFYFDLVITDVVMPKMSGFELIQEIKKVNEHQIFMMVTSLDKKDELLRAIELGVNFFVEKPINIDKFTKALEEAIYLVTKKQELAHSNTLLQQYKHALDESSLLSKSDLSGKITFVNKEFCRISKYSESELIGKSHSILRHEDMPASTFKDMWASIQAKKQWRGVIKNRAKDGTEYIVNTLITPILNSDGEIIEYVGVRHDITELEQYKEDLQKKLDIATKDIIETQKEVIFTMGAIGETRSKETGMHVKRVAEYSYTLAILAGRSEHEAELLKLASPMHDIGKVGIADSILNKPGKLTFEEFEIMKAHSTLGYEMLKGSNKEIMQTSAIIAHEHHEKWNGKGYPRGLKEEQISIIGRITAICDVFDALGSDRCYKKAWELEKILDLLKEERGFHFDPNLIDLFLNNLEKFLVIRDKYID